VAARTPRTRHKPRAARPEAGPLSYWERSKQPLEILALLVPLIVLYEVGLVRWLASAHGVQTNDAHRGLVHLFESFGMDATRLGLPVLSLPALAMVVVLLVLHVLSRKPWSVDLPTVAGMVVEGALAGLPLYVLVRAVMGVSMMAAAAAPGTWLGDRILISIGAGLYEEFIFRMVALLLLHSLLADLLRVKDPWATWIAVVIAAIAFAAYHPLRGATGAVQWPVFASLLVAGLYFGGLYVVRGFGIAVAAHASYDIVVAALASPAG
jgi:hypothetical protein